MILSTHNSKIVGISCVIPTKELNLLDDSSLYNGNQKKIQRVIESSGFLKRRVVDQKTTTADLCIKAAVDLLENLRIVKSEIDALLFLSYTPDYLMPATSYVIHNKLGLSEECICMDIPQACSGYVIGLYQASLLINSGCKKVLLLVGDTFSKFTDMFINNTAPVFGDAGTATLIEFDQNAESCFFNLKTDSTNYDALICKNGGFRNPTKKEDFYDDNSYRYLAKMDGARVFDFTMKRILPSIEEILSYSKHKVTDIDYFIMHQANKMILENIASSLQVPSEKLPIGLMTIFGNQCGASIPCSISYYLRNEVQNKKLKLLFCGFGVGLSWASSILTTNNIYCSNLIDYTN